MTQGSHQGIVWLLGLSANNFRFRNRLMTDVCFALIGLEPGKASSRNDLKSADAPS